MPAAAGDVTEAAGEHGLANPDRPQDEDAERLLQKAQGAELVPELAVEVDRGGVVPELQAHGGVEMSGAGAQIAAGAVAAGGLVGEHELQKVLVGQLLLAGELEPFGKGLQDGRELETAEHLAELSRDRKS